MIAVVIEHSPSFRGQGEASSSMHIAESDAGPRLPLLWSKSVSFRHPSCIYPNPMQVSPSGSVNLLNQ
jgi:hypothetical protein